MSMQMALIGAQSSSTITAQSANIAHFAFNSGSVALGFLSNADQVLVADLSSSILGKWVAPSTSANEWEIRAILVSGDTPSGPINTWESLSTSRQWSFDLTTIGIRSCELTFQFRREGVTDPEVTVGSNFMSIQVSRNFKL